MAIMNADHELNSRSTIKGDFNAFLLSDGIHKKSKKDILGEEIRVAALRFITINKLRSRLLDWEI